MPDLSDEIEQVASEPQSSTTDGETATSHSLPDLIKADQYLAGKTVLADASENGGTVSGWNLTRPAIARFKSPG